VLTTLNQYFKLPLDHHPLYCHECDNSLLGDGMVLVWKLMAGDEIVLCRRCAETVGFALWTDDLIAAGVKHD